MSGFLPWRSCCGSGVQRGGWAQRWGTASAGLQPPRALQPLSDQSQPEPQGSSLGGQGGQPRSLGRHLQGKGAAWRCPWGKPQGQGREPVGEARVGAATGTDPVLHCLSCDHPVNQLCQLDGQPQQQRELVRMQCLRPSQPLPVETARRQDARGMAPRNLPEVDISAQPMG